MCKEGENKKEEGKQMLVRHWKGYLMDLSEHSIELWKEEIQAARDDDSQLVVFKIPNSTDSHSKLIKYIENFLQHAAR